MFATEDAARTASELFGIKGEIDELPSERDRNFRIRVNDEEAFVLKIAAETESEECLILQNAVMAHLQKVDPSLRIPQVLPSRHGLLISTVKNADGRSHKVRLLTYLPGRTLAEVNPHTAELLCELGAFIGRLTLGLKDFSHPAAHRDFYWDIKNASRVIDQYAGSIESPDDRKTVDYFLRLFVDNVLPNMHVLDESVIHNDANDYNLIVAYPSPGAAREFGIIDFGDMVYSCRLFELAIAAAYAVLDKPDPLVAAAQVVGGYNSVMALSDTELRLLFPIICIRLASSVCIAARQRKAEPDNTYLGISEQQAWRTLAKLRGIHPNRAWYVFRDACGLSACPHGPRVVRWLRENQKSFADLLGGKLRAEKKVVLDLSVGSLDYEYPPDVLDAGRFQRTVGEKLASSGATIAIGRYDEARLIYGGSQYLPASATSIEPRTVHIALDLFVPKGTPVHAPIDGVVHSFRNNNVPYDNGPTIVLEHKIAEGLSFYTLYAHLSVDSIANLKKGQTILKGKEFARVGEFPTNGGWPSHLHFQLINDMLGVEGDFYGVAWPSQRSVWTSICPDPNLITGIPGEVFPERKLTMKETRELRREYIGPSLGIAYREPLKIVRGYMQHLYDEDGRPYLDAVNNVPHVGHSNPTVVHAIQRQVAALNTNTRYLHDVIVQYARKLCSTLPEPLKVCFFLNSGSEANELALRLAKTHTGRNDIIVIDGAYHGNTEQLVDISPYKHDGPGGKGTPPYVHKVPMADAFRGQYRSTDPKAGLKYAEHIGEIIRQATTNHKEVAAFICEPLMSCGGQIVFPPGYLKEAFRHVRQAGGVCIADEVQTGFGRVGTHFWAFETQDVVPDIVTMGKPMGNGFPLAAVVTTREIADSFNNGMEFFSTTGGNPVACAAGMAVLEVIERDHLQENALRVGSHLLKKLNELKDKHDIIGDVRGIGLFVGAELIRNRTSLEPAAEEATYVINRMKEMGVLLSTDGPLHNVIKIKPPIIFSEADVDFLVKRLDLVLNEDSVKRKGC